MINITQWLKHTALASIICIIPATGFAADFDKGLEAHNLDNYKAALAEFTPLAEQGNVKAQEILGDYYNFGLGVPKNHKTSVKWYTKAAKQGNSYAQKELGWKYYKGSGVLTDFRRSYMWWDISAFNGYNMSYGLKEETAKEMTPADISKAQDMSSRCLESNYTDC